MNKWLDTFVAEKGLNLDHIFEVEGKNWGMNYIPLQCIVDLIKVAPKVEQEDIKRMIVKIDFINGDVMHFFKHLAKAVAR